jgi:DNA-binding IclR family transcriptional regulator
MTDTAAPDVVESYLRLAKVRDLLWEHMVHGLSPTEIAAAAREPKSYVTRAMQTLRAAGDAEQIADTGRWRISVRYARHAVAVYRSLDRGAARIEEIRGRIGTLS